MDKDPMKARVTGTDHTTFKRDGGKSRASGSGTRVLVVEDNQLNAKLVLAQLEQGGYEATSVESGEAALDALASASYSFVLMDCELPGMDGCTTTRKIRLFEAPERHTMVIGFSSNTPAAARAKCLEAGMDDYIARPVTASELATRLQMISSKNVTAATHEGLSNAVRSTPTVTLDANVLIELAMLPGADGDPLLVELTAIFLRKLPAMIGDLSVADSASTADVARAAHRLKSASTTIGGKRLAALCEKIEKACDSSSSARLVMEAREAAAQLTEMLRKIPLR